MQLNQYISIVYQLTHDPRFKREDFLDFNILVHELLNRPQAVLTLGTAQDKPKG